MFKLLTILILVGALPVVAHAGSGVGAWNMSINTSVRAAAMGDAGVAVVWDMDTNHWANPALLAFRPGIHYSSLESDLAPSLQEKSFLTNEELTLGAYGVTFLLARGPVDGNFLDLGRQEVTNEVGEITGYIDSYRKSESWGLGVEGVEVLESIMGKPLGAWSRYIGLAGGITLHDYIDELGSDTGMQDPDVDGGTGGSAVSMGYVLRVTPIDNSSGRGFLNNGLWGLRVSGSYGASVLNKTDDFIMRDDIVRGDPFPRAYVSGWALNAQLTLRDDLREKLNDFSLGILGDMINPLFSATRTGQQIEPGYLWNPQTSHYDYERDTNDDNTQKGRGWELGVMNILFYRGGDTYEKGTQLDGETIGRGWKIQAGRYGGFRKDWAEVAQGWGQPVVRRESWSFWVNPLAIYDEISNH